jgi:hypothetical protein
VLHASTLAMLDARGAAGSAKWIGSPSTFGSPGINAASLGRLSAQSEHCDHGNDP